MTVVGVVVAAVLGGWARFGAQSLLPTWLGTVVVNVAGSLLAGLAVGWDGARHTVLVIGGLGALTSVSAAMADHRALTERRGRGTATAYAAATIAGCCAAAWLGIELAA